jgi:hypothetical protein
MAARERLRGWHFAGEGARATLFRLSTCEFGQVGAYFREYGESGAGLDGLGYGLVWTGGASCFVSA